MVFEIEISEAIPPPPSQRPTVLLAIGASSFALKKILPLSKAVGEIATKVAAPFCDEEKSSEVGQGRFQRRGINTI